MLSIQENISLLPYNTFHIDARAKSFVVIRTLADLRALLNLEQFKTGPRLFLGGGSNVLFTKDFDGLVIKNEITGIERLHEDADRVVLKVGSGENWHGFVMYCVEKNFGGVENLSLIPGTVGAAPMQNIGAYGVEVKDVIAEVEAVNLLDASIRVFSKADCQFGYRESFFKHEGKGVYFISSVTLTLTKRNHVFNVSYGAIKETLEKMNVENNTIRAISDAVIHIRKSKLPDPAVVGNAGSFFKNPSILAHEFAALKQKWPSVPGYPEDDNRVKVPAGWLIEQCEWKGKTFSSIGVHPLQALVLVNYGGGEGKDIWNLAMDIRQSVKNKFNIDLHPEVNIIQ